jgi:CubicO group peptidase (beta-lactamase class C family)
MRPVGVTLANWQEPAHTGWGYRHVRELIPSARIAHSETAVALVPPDGPVPTGLAVEQVAADARSDGVLVLHRGQLVFEHYGRGMRPDDVHLLQSVSKSITGALTGVLAAAGALRPEDLVTAHVPELAGSSLEGATVRHLLDMTAGTRFDETYSDPHSDIRASEAQFGWAPGPPPAADAIAFIAALGTLREHGARFDYRSILTDVLGVVLQRASGRPFADVLGAELWSRIGAETDAYVTVDKDGFAVPDGGICVSLRDLARFGQMVLGGGTVGGAQVVPAEWLADTRQGGPESAAMFALDDHVYDFPGGHYRNQWWVPAGGQQLIAMGIHGQCLYVDHLTDTVIAQLSTWEDSLDPSRRATNLRAFAQTCRQLADA